MITVVRTLYATVVALLALSVTAAAWHSKPHHHHVLALDVRPPPATTTTVPATTTTTALVATTTPPTTTSHTTTPPAVHVSSAGWVWPWSCISHYESGGNPAENTGNGYYGGLQFLLQTWWAHGGTGRPDQASIAVQEQIADNVVRADHGSYREWATAPKCGLPTY